MRKRSTFWFLLWIVFIGIGSVFSAVSKYSSFFLNGIPLDVPPFTDFQLLTLLLFTPFVLIPLLCITWYYANKEKNKWLKITSFCLLLHHIICVIAVLFQVI